MQGRERKKQWEGDSQAEKTQQEPAIVGSGSSWLFFHGALEGGESSWPSSATLHPQTGSTQAGRCLARCLILGRTSGAAPLSGQQLDTQLAEQAWPMAPEGALAAIRSG